MNLVGRYERGRWYNTMTGRVGAPVLIDYRAVDRQEGACSPFGGEEWWRSKSGRWYQVQDLLRSKRGVTGFDGAGSYFSWSLGVQSDYAQSFANNISLNSAYTAGSAGAAYAQRFALPDARTISKIYTLVSSYTGTAGNVTNQNMVTYPDNGSNAPTTASPVANGSGTVNPASNTSWISVSGLTAALSANTIYWVSVHNTAGSGTDFPIMRNRDGGGSVGSNNLNSHCYSTTNGWSSVTSHVAGGSYIVIVFSDGTAIGCPFSTAVTPTSNTLYRGMYMSGFTQTISVLGFAGALGVASTPTFTLFAGATLPSGSAFATGTALWQTIGSPTLVGACIFPANTIIQKATPYRFVAKGSSNSSFVRVYGPGTVGIGSAADIFAAAPGKGGWYYTEATATPDWANDNTAAFPAMNILFGDQSAVAGNTAPFSRIFTGQ